MHFVYFFPLIMFSSYLGRQTEPFTHCQPKSMTQARTAISFCFIVPPFGLMPSPPRGRYPGLLVAGLTGTSLQVVRNRLSLSPFRPSQPRLSPCVSRHVLLTPAKIPPSLSFVVRMNPSTLTPTPTPPPTPSPYIACNCPHPWLIPRPHNTMAPGHQQSRSHSSHHHDDNVYLTSTNKRDPAVRITRIGLFSNLAMAVAKGAGGIVFNSQSMVADAWHSLTDLASDVLTLATVSWSIKPPTDNFPAGFGKVESLGSLGVSGMLLVGGMFMCTGSCETLYAHFFLDPGQAAEFATQAHGHTHGHAHAHAHDAPNVHASWLAFGTIIIKEWLYQASMSIFHVPTPHAPR